MSETSRLDTVRKAKLKARADADRSLVEELKKVAKKPARKAYEDLGVFRRIHTVGPMESFPTLVTNKPIRRPTNHQTKRKLYWRKEPLSGNSRIWDGVNRPRSRRVNEETSKERDTRIRGWLNRNHHLRGWRDSQFTFQFPFPQVSVR